MPYKNPEDRDKWLAAHPDYMKKWQEAHRDRMRKWRAENPEKAKVQQELRKERMRQWMAENPEKVDEYKRKAAERKRKWREANPDKVKASLKKNGKIKQNKCRNLINSIKSKYGCCNPNCPCVGELPPYCLDFHHIDKASKEFCIGASNHTISQYVREMSKCTVLCAVCHRMETWGELDASGFARCKVEQKQVSEDYILALCPT